MGQTEITIFIVVITAILLILISGILLFIIQYRKRKLLYEKQTTMLNEAHHREMLQAQLQIQSQTMQDIGREIHDNVGQRLTLASIYANQMLARRRASDHNEQIAVIGNIIDESLAELRSLSKSLVSNDAESGELAAILHRECDRVAALNTCRISCQVTETHFGVSAAVKNFVIRIAQEALQNSLKHAKCQSMELRLEYEESSGLTLMINDDGHGFDTTAPPSGIGLENMRQRAVLIGGTFNIHSGPMAGTMLRLFIPAEKLQPM